jgi:DNA mismatch endonuclease (patch repair protein)
MSLSREILSPVTTNSDGIDKRRLRKGKTYEEIYGVEFAKLLREKQKLVRLGKPRPKMRGRHLSLKTEFKKGRVPWNKGLYGEEFLQYYPNGTIWNKGVPMREETRKIQREQKLGKPLSMEHKERISLGVKRRLENDPQYRVNISLGIRNKIRTDPDFLTRNLFSRKSGQKNRDTEIELKLQNGLDSIGVPFIANKSIIYDDFWTIPDIILLPIESKIVIFADGDYWHTLPNQEKKDSQVTKSLQERGWTVLRFRGKEIKKNLGGCIKTIVDAYRIRDCGASLSSVTHVSVSDCNAKYGGERIDSLDQITIPLNNFCNSTH